MAFSDSTSFVALEDGSYSMRTSSEAVIAWLDFVLAFYNDPLRNGGYLDDVLPDPHRGGKRLRFFLPNADIPRDQNLWAICLQRSEEDLVARISAELHASILSQDFS